MITYLKTIGYRVLVAVLAATAPWLGAKANDFTATDAQGVIYNKIPGTKNVIISNENANKFYNTVADLVIPAVITDVSTSSMGTGETYTVVGMQSKAFLNSRIKSIVIEAPLTEIPDSAFCNTQASNLQSVTLPSSVTRIGSYAFYQCYSLSTLNIADWSSIEGIGDYAFYNCSSLSFDLTANNLKKIGWYAFYNTKVKSVAIPSIEEIGLSAFNSCYSLSSLTLGDNLKAIPYEAFRNCSSLGEITLPANLETIGDNAFSSCSQLTIANQWPSNLREIGKQAFSSCNKFGNLILKPGIIYGQYAFQYSYLPSIDWSDSYVELKYGCFANSSGLTELTPPSWMKTIPSGLFSQAKVQTLNLTENVEKVDTSAFASSSLSKINFSTGLKSIEPSAFANCSQLTTISLPAGVELRDYAFYQNYFTSITFPEEPLYFLTEEGAPSAPFMYSRKLTSFTFPPYITNIDSPNSFGFFSDCSQLTKVDATSLVAIPQYTFRNLTKLTSVTLGPNLKTVDAEAFFKCTALTSLNCPASEYIDKNAFDGCTKISTLTLGSAFVPIGTIPTTVTTLKFSGEKVRLEPMAIKDFKKLTIEFLPGVKHIADSAFIGMYHGRNTLITFCDGIESIGDYAFYDARNNKTTTFPTSLKHIGKYAFAEYHDIYTSNGVTRGFEIILNLPNIEHVGYGAFLNYSNIYNINLPQDRAVEIEPFAFACPGLRSFTIPSWMEKIPAGLIACCPETWSQPVPPTTGPDGQPFVKDFELNIPETVKEIGDSAFFGYNPASIVLPATKIKFGKFAFGRNSKISSFTIPEYITELPDGFFYNWSELTEIGNYDNVTSLGAYSMAGTPNFQHPLEYSNQIEYIGSYAFYNAKSVPEYEQSGFDRWVSLPGVEIAEDTELDKYALAGAPFESIDFKGCRTSLPEGCLRGVYAPKGINLPTCMEEIPDSLFMGSAFATNNLPITSNIKRIGNYAFAGAKIRSTAPLTLTIPESVEEIGECAFNNLRIPDELNKYNPSFCDIEVVLPQTPVKLGRGAFANMGKLVKINLPAYITELPDSCFRCFRRSTKEYPYTLTIEERDGSTYPKKLNVGYNALLGATADQLDLSDHEVTLHPHAFFETHIKDICLPNSVTEVPAACFAYSDIEQMALGDQLTCLGDSAFYSCAALTKVSIASLPNEIKGYTFAECPLLEEVILPENVTDILPYAFSNLPLFASIKIPDATTQLRQNAFSNCNGLKRLDLGKNMQIIDAEAMRNSSIEELTWPTTIASIGDYAFAGSHIKNLHFPDGYDPSQSDLKDSGFKAHVFDGCPDLETVTFGNVAPELMGTYMFSNCTALKSVDLGPSLTRVNYNAFQGCTALTDVNFGNVKNIWDYAFDKCSSLTGEFTFKNVTSVGERGFSDCNKIEKIHFKQPSVDVDKSAFASSSDQSSALTEVIFDGVMMNGMGSAFANNDNLTTFKAGGDIYLGGSTFSGCTSLTDIVLPELTSIKRLSGSDFARCTSLKSFPYLQYVENMREAWWIFDDCSALRQITLPEKGDYVANLMDNSIGNQGIFRHCTDLQSFTVPYTDGKFRMGYYEILDAPLQAVSYSYATDIEAYPYLSSNIYYYGGGNVENKGILYVKRGQKWKYLESGYGNRFEIIEMKEPVINIEGNLFADYDVTVNKNHYLGYLRWQLALSDLHETNSTVAHLYRKAVYPPTQESQNSEESQESQDSQDRGDLIATITFNPPSKPKHVDGFSQDVIEVTYTVEVPKGSDVQSNLDGTFDGGFELPILDYYGNRQYQWIQAPKQDNALYFDAVTTKRLNTFDNYNSTSWFILCDRFDSPLLTDEKVPVSYTYSADIVPYDFDKYVNNPNCELENGTRYKLVTDNTGQFKSTPKTFNAAVILPTIDFEGCHSFVDIVKDTNHNLAASTGHDPGKAYRLGWHINSDDLGRKVYFNGTPHQVFESISIVELDKKEGDPYILREYPITEDATGDVVLNNLSTVKGGKKYQIIVNSPSRGHLSSRALTIPNIPDLKVESLTWKYAPDFMKDPGGHTALNVYTELTLSADAEPMGYGKGLPEGKFHLGAWRTVGSSVPLSFRAEGVDTAEDENTGDESETDQAVLIHHIGGVQTTDEAPNCGSCARETSVTTNADGTITISDYFHHGINVNNIYRYDTRLYVKVPDGMIPGDERWMAVDADRTVTNTVTGIDEVLVDQVLTEMQTADEDIRWYDLQGRPVANPVSGQPYIRATRTAAQLVRF